MVTLPSDRAARSAGIWEFIKREPLVHFLVLTALLFLASAVFSGDDREVITVDKSTKEYLVQQKQELLLRDMSDEEKAEIVQNFIDEEILVREARKRGFEDSSRIRTLLIQNMRFFLASDVPDPTETDLRAYFEDNIARFETGPAVTYEHVFFSDPVIVPADMLDRLRAGADYRRIDGINMSTATLPRADERRIVAVFGRDEAPRILQIDDDQWHGAFTSRTGVHFLRVAERHPKTRPDFESARHWLRQEWILTKRREIVDRKLAEMRENYRIDVQKPEDGQ